MTHYTVRLSLGTQARHLPVTFSQSDGREAGVDEAIRTSDGLGGVMSCVAFLKSGEDIEGRCERSVGTVFQLPSPDAIYSQDEGKERRQSLSLVVCVHAGSTCC
jgi:hypothetical protein